jgi:large subunit ribosomal protein L13
MGKGKMKTFVPKSGEIPRGWFIVDAAGQPLGRLAVEVAKILRGKHRPIFTPNADTGEFVIVINADKVGLTGKKEGEPLYHHTGYPGGIKEISKGTLRTERPIRLVERTIKGMLPHNKIGAEMFRKLKVYGGADHPHAAQQPRALSLEKPVRRVVRGAV